MNSKSSIRLYSLTIYTVLFMLYGLRAGAPLYALYKTDPRLEVLEVVSVSNPMPQFPTYTAGMPQLQPSRVVDIQARRGEELVKFEKVPADVPIADFGPTSGIVLSENREAILAEIDAFQKQSQRRLEEVPRLQHNVEECEKMKQALNPSLKKEAETTERLDSLEKRLEGLSGVMSDIRSLLRSEGKNKKEE